MVSVALFLAAAFVRPMERVSTMDPAMATSLYEAQSVRLVYEAPLAIDYAARPYRLAPEYCELPEVSADGLVYTFKTLHGPAADMVSSLERLRDPKLISPSAWIMKDVASVRATAADRVEIRLKRCVSYFPWLMSMSQCGVRDANGAGTGAFVLEKWRKNHEMVFKRKPSALEPNTFDEVRYLVVDDASTKWLMFLKGELDYLDSVSRDNWESVVDKQGQLVPELQRRGIQMHHAPSLDSFYLGFNMTDPIVGKNRKLRQALNAAFDFPAWNRFFNNRIRESGGPVPAGVEGALPVETFPYRFNLNLAKRLMAEAGYPNGIDPQTGRRLVLTLSIGRADQESRESGELTAAFFEKIGIKLELRFHTWDAFLKATSEGRVQLFRMGWVGDYPAAQNFLQLFYSPNMRPGVNRSGYSNPEYDQAYEREDWRRCQEILREDCPWVFQHFNVINSLTGPRVGNFIPGAFLEGAERWFRHHE